MAVTHTTVTFSSKKLDNALIATRQSSHALHISMSASVSPLRPDGTHRQATTQSGSVSRHTALDRRQVPCPLHSPRPLPVVRPGHDRCTGGVLAVGVGDGPLASGDGILLADADDPPMSPGLDPTCWGLLVGLGLGWGSAYTSWSQCSPMKAVLLQSHTAPSPVTTHVPPPQSSAAQPVTWRKRSRNQRRHVGRCGRAGGLS
jgi:hypothetical protein